LLKDDRDQRVRQLIVMGLRHVRDPKSNGTAEALEKVLDETGEEGRIVRYDAARVLAFLLQGKAPPKAVTVLEAMLNHTRLVEDKGTDPTLNKGDESVKSTTGGQVKRGNDARYMAANALGVIAANKRDDALQVLKAAAQSKDEAKKKAAEGAMKLF